MATASTETPDAPAPDMSLTDHGFEPLESRGLTYPMGKFAPEYGVVHPLGEGLGWTRLPVPGLLKHINVWLLEDDGGVALVDTGLKLPESKDAWRRALDGRPVSRVLVTHFHPDHLGLAGWLCFKHGAPLWMNRTEYLLARMLIADKRDEPPVEAVTQAVEAGWTPEQVAPFKARGWGNFAAIVSPMPVGHVRIKDGDVIRIGARDWTVWVGSGHTPEHVCFVDLKGKVMIAGDQVLPRITSNVSVTITEPTGDPLGDWLASIEKFRALPDDLLVLPAHGEPFYGLHARLDRLEEGHRTSLNRLHAHLTVEPRRAVDCFGVLFGRAIDDSILGLATGEALAHLRHLEVTGRATFELREGVRFYSAA
ncbi:MBL fold metallo-hydrolase [Sphingomonas sp. SUN039]|uniref:MBL fold metallo-hydrolase n=1 Tax=Sphingomonas sp. SUN039 TaxID=2937787 RepID=UPI00216462AC|nr:MBL fold metallo-hydrolase [Sphingomonas sp. SUN039]UVO54638.1 MBL fold metallo-hydrolase [Sphingomonas sp. SUN039]